MREQRSNRSNDRGGTQSTLSHQRPSALKPVISIHIHTQESHSQSARTPAGDFAQLYRYLDLRESSAQTGRTAGGHSVHTQSSAAISGHQQSSAFTFTLRNHVHSQLGRQPATSLNSTDIWIYERAALKPVERQRGHSVHTQSSAAISGHQRSSTVINGHQQLRQR